MIKINDDVGDDLNDDIIDDFDANVDDDIPLEIFYVDLHPSLREHCW